MCLLLPSLIVVSSRPAISSICEDKFFLSENSRRQTPSFVTPAFISPIGVSITAVFITCFNIYINDKRRILLPLSPSPHLSLSGTFHDQCSNLPEVLLINLVFLNLIADQSSSIATN